MLMQVIIRMDGGQINRKGHHSYPPNTPQKRLNNGHKLQTASRHWKTQCASNFGNLRCNQNLPHTKFAPACWAICYPGFEDALEGAFISDDYVVTDSNYITAKGAGVSVEFGLEIVKKLVGEEAAEKVRSAIQCR